MGKVKYATGIQYVNGSLSKPTVKAGHKHGSYLIGTHRTAATTNPDCTRIYVRDNDTYERTSPVTAKEQKQRARFAFVANKVKLRSKDLSQISDDQAAFIAQKDAPNGKKTMKSYLWSLELATYDAEHAND